MLDIELDGPRLTNTIFARKYSNTSMLAFVLPTTIATAAGVIPFFTCGFNPLARVTLYLTDRKTSCDFRGRRLAYLSTADSFSKFYHSTKVQHREGTEGHSI